MTDRSQANKDLILELVRRMDRRDFSVLDELCARDCIAHFMGVGLNIEQIRKAALEFSAAFSSLQHSIEDMIAEGDRVVLRAVDQGIHMGTYRGIPATGKSVKFETIAIYRIVNNEIVEIWQQMDVPGLLKQLEHGN